MKFLQKILDFYINASIHVALAAVAFVKITEIYFDLPSNLYFDLFVLFGTITGYNFVKFAGVAKLHHRSLTDSLKVIQIFSFLSFLALCYTAYKLPLKTLLYCLPFAGLTFLYAIPLFSGFEKNLREIRYLKILIVALVWAAFTMLLPLINYEYQIGYEEVLLFIQRFLLILVLVLPFEIRDLQYDKISLQTLPQKIGVPKTKRIGVILLVVSLILEYLANTSSEVKTPFMLFFFVILIMLMRSKISQSKYYSSFWVEAIPIFWWLLLLGFYNF